MANKLDNIRANLSDTKVRSVFIIVLIIFLLTALLGYFYLKRATQTQQQASPAGVVKPPAGIKNIPGIGTPSTEYTNLQEQQNRQLAEAAIKAGTAAVPTLTSPTYLGNGLPATTGTEKPGCDPTSLKKAREAGVAVFELHCRGCDAAALRAAGFTAAELASAGFSPDQLKAAGFTDQELQEAGLVAAAQPVVPTGAKDCSVEALREAKAKGMTAAQLKDCGAAALKQAGFTAKELKDAGFSAGELRVAGFDAKELKDAGFSAGDLRNAGFSAEDLKNAGFSTKELKDAGFTDGDLIRAGFDPNEIRPVRIITPPSQVPGAQVPGGPAQIVPSPDKQQRLQDILAQIRAQQEQDLSRQERDNKRQQLEESMLTQVGQLFSSWTPLPDQKFVEAPPPAQPKSTAAIATATGGKAVSSKDLQFADADSYKAGTVFFGVLDTGINSDEKSPIMATIVQGKLKGAKLLGDFAREGKKVVLKFTTLGVPYLDQSIPISAYAIDPYTARTALASSVNNHYLLKYGTIFAASFLSGLGEALQNSGGQTVVTDEGSLIHTWAKLNPSEKALVGVGKAGEKISQELTSQFANIPPTIKVSAGSGIGLLLMADLKVPKQVIVPVNFEEEK